MVARLYGARGVILWERRLLPGEGIATLEYLATMLLASSEEYVAYSLANA